MGMLEFSDDGLEFARGSTEVGFALPAVLRTAVLESRDYAWFELNALLRFSSRFTAGIYLRLCYEAGKHWRYREILEPTKNEFREIMGLPGETQSSVLDDAINRVSADLEAIDGPRRRFSISFGKPIDDAPSSKFFIEVGGSAKRLKEVKPKFLTEAAREQVLDRTRHKIDSHQYPTLTRLRQAATLLGTSVLSVSDLWRIDVKGAVSYPDDIFVGLTGREFLRLIADTGPDDVLEFWVDKRDFSHLGVKRQVEPELTPAVDLMPQPGEAPASKSNINLADLIHGLKIVDEEIIDPFADGGLEAPDIADDEIDY